MNIFLIGYRGSGKTAVGREVARKMEVSFVDLDDELEKSAGMSIAEIFDGKGERAFREIERDVFSKIAEKRDQIVATGGGIVLLDANIHTMQDRGIVVHLDCDASIAAGRIESDPRTPDTRPKFTDTDLLSEVRMQMRIRRPQYRTAADLTVDSSRTSPAETADEIFRKLVEEGGLEHETEPKYRTKKFSEMQQLNLVRLPNNTRVLTEDTGSVYRVNPIFFCDSCASPSSVLVRLEGTDRLRCAQCAEWIEVDRVEGSEYEFYLPRRWKEAQRKEWYETWKLRRSVHIETRRMLKDYLSALTLPDEEEKTAELIDDDDEGAVADRTLSPELAAYYVRVLEGEDIPEPENLRATTSRTATGTEIVDLTPAQPLDPVSIGAPPTQAGLSHDSEIIDLTPAQPFNPASITAPPYEEMSSEADIIELTPAQPFDPATIGAPRKPETGRKDRSKKTRIVFSSDSAGADAPPVPEQAAPQPAQPTAEDQMAATGGKGKTRIVWGSASSAPAQPEKSRPSPSQPQEKAPPAQPQKTGRKRTAKKTRIVFSDQDIQPDAGQQSPFEQFDQQEKKKRQPPPPPQL